MKNNKNFLKKFKYIILIIFISSVVSFASGIYAVLRKNNIKSDDALTLNNLTNKLFGTKETNGNIENDIFKTQEDLIVKIVEKINPSVVSVVASKDMPIIEQYYINPFQDDGLKDLIPPELFPDVQIPQFRKKGVEKRQVSSGSGFFVSSNGYILTNKHVVEDKQADYTIITNSGKKIKAKVMARDNIQDIAILKIEGNNYPFIPLGDSEKVKVGQTVIAIGNALGEFQNTVSVGVISGLRRTITAFGTQGGSETLKSLMQTDAAINPGNSGGPLLDLNGRVIGINTAMASGAENIGFALPINFAKKDIDDIKKFSRIRTPFIGVRYVLVNEDVKRTYKLPVDYGAMIIKGQNDASAVVPGSPAQKAGLREGDIILEFDNKKIDISTTIADIIIKKSVNDRVLMKILRNGKEINLYVILDELKNG